MRLATALISALAVFVTLPAFAQGTDATDPDPQEVYLDLVWCDEDAEMHERVAADVIARRAELTGAERTLLDSFAAPKISRLDLFIHRQMIATFTELPDQTRLDQTRVNARAFWFGAPEDVHDKLDFLMTRADLFNKDRPNCFIRVGQAAVIWEQAGELEIHGEAFVAEEVFDAIAPIDTSDPDSFVASLMAAILSDGQIDIAERYLIRELLFGDVSLKHGERTMMLPGVSEAAWLHLLLFAGPMNVTDLWQTTPELGNLFLYMSDVAPVAEIFARDRIALVLLDVSLRKGFPDTYQPLKDEIAKIRAIAAAMPDASAGKRYRQIAYDAMVLVDEHRDDVIPDSLYSGLRQ